MDKTQKNLLLAMVLSIGLLFVFQYFTPKTAIAPVTMDKDAKGPNKTVNTEAATAEKAIKEEKKKEEVKKINKIIGKDVTIETDDVIAVFDTKGARIKSWALKSYTEEGKLYDLIWKNPETRKPLEIVSPENNIDDSDIIYEYKRDGLGLEFTGKTAGKTIKKSIKLFQKGYKADCQISIISDKGETIKPARIYINTGIDNYIPINAEDKIEKKNITTINTKAAAIREIAFIDEKVKYEKPKAGEEKSAGEGKLLWAGIKDKYFISVMIFNTEAEIKGIVGRSYYPVTSIEKKTEGKEITETSSKTSVELPYSAVELREAKDGQKASFTMYFGPLLYENLDELKVWLYKALDYGWFNWLGIWMLLVMKLAYKIFGNYGIAIIALTIIIKAILWWPTQSSYRSMKKMQEAQPHIAALKEQYKNDMQKQNEEMMKIYKEKKINPLGGCLPLLLQLPIFYALYMVFVNAIELKNASFMLWITDLSLKDPYYVLPILMGVSMLIQQKMTPSADPAQAKMMMILPVVFTFMFASLPAGVILYWVVQNVLSIFQQWLVNKKPAVTMQE